MNNWSNVFLMFFLAELRAARETSANMGKEMGGAELAERH